MNIRAKWIFLLMCILMMQGCETLKEAGQGAKVGAKKDWQSLKKTDVWLQEKMW